MGTDTILFSTNAIDSTYWFDSLSIPFLIPDHPFSVKVKCQFNDSQRVQLVPLCSEQTPLPNANRDTLRQMLEPMGLSLRARLSVSCAGDPSLNPIVG